MSKKTTNTADVLAINVQDLRKTYNGGFEALRGLTLEIPKGAFFGLLGPNGAGKSTLIHCLTGLSSQTSGKATILGHDVIKDYKNARASIGLSPQEINLDWFLSVEDTLDYHGGYHSMPKAKRKEQIEKLLKAFQLWDKRKDNIRKLSGGMKRRLVIARALMHEPKVLILDEPTAGVDIELRRSLWEYMKKENKAGTTILLTTHYIEEAEELCDQIALINNGQILYSGTKEAIKKHYKQKTLEDVYLNVIHGQNKEGEK
jgi:ABC-2 type transport system ATP-binding protein